MATPQEKDTMCIVVCRLSEITELCMGERERNVLFNDTLNTFYLASDIWLRTILIVRTETHCHHIGYSYRLTARVLLYAPSHRQDNTISRPLLHQSWSTGWNEKRNLWRQGRVVIKYLRKTLIV